LSDFQKQNSAWLFPFILNNFDSVYKFIFDGSEIIFFRYLSLILNRVKYFVTGEHFLHYFAAGK